MDNGQGKEVGLLILFFETGNRSRSCKRFVKDSSRGGGTESHRVRILRSSSGSLGISLLSPVTPKKITIPYYKAY